MNIQAAELKSLLKRVSSAKAENITLTPNGVVAQDSDLTVCSASEKLAGLPTVSVNSRKFSAVVNRLSGSVEIVPEGNAIKVTAGKTKVVIESTVPRPQKFLAPETLYTLPLAPVKELLKYVSVAADPTKAAMTGGVVQFETVVKGIFEDEQVVGFEAMGTDGKRCAYATVDGVCGGQFVYQIPLPAVAALQNLDGETVQLGETQNSYFFKTANVTVYANRLAKQVVNYKAYLPREFSFTASVAVEDFRQVLHVVEPMIQEAESNAVLVHFLDGRLHIKTVGTGSAAEDETTFEGTGEFKAKYNHRFLSDYLSTVSGKVAFQANHPEKPVILESGNKKMMLMSVIGGTKC